jgi:hypothetical protein
MRRKLLVLAIGLTGCATAHRDSLGGRPDSGITIGGDSNNNNNGDSGVQMDAPPHIDGSMGGTTQTLSQTMASNDTQVGIACSGSNTTTSWTSQNSYYRVFQLSNYGINGTFHVTGIDFIVSAASKSPQLNIGIGTYNGTTGGQTINTAGITLTQTTTFAPPDTTTAVPQHIDIAADITGNLVVEIDQNTAGTSANPLLFYMGANEAGESVPGYISSTDCSLSTPTSMDFEAGQLQAGSHADMVLTVTGST